jgi:hypothetical protein
VRALPESRPGFLKRCAACRVTWQLPAAECTRCCPDRKLKADLHPARRHRLAGTGPAARGHSPYRPARPHAGLVGKAGVRCSPQAAAARRVVTHEALDTLPPGRTLALCGRCWLRPARARPGRAPHRPGKRIARVIAGRTTPEHRRALHRYAVWHHLRRLRGRLHGQPASAPQVKNVRNHVTATAVFLDWLDTGWAELERFLQTDPRGCGRRAGTARPARLCRARPQRHPPGAGAARRYPAVAAHMLACRPCAEDYRGLLSAQPGQPDFPCRG